MFVIDYTLDLGAFGLHDASVVGVVERDEFKHYRASIKRVVVQLEGFAPFDATGLLRESELCRIEERLINKYIAAESLAETAPEDWPRDEGA